MSGSPQSSPPSAAASVSSSLNPLLEYQPAYTYSMPTQLLILGIVLTLLCVLLLHLLFTAKYHYPLSRCNFILLLSAVVLTHISTIILVIFTNIYLFNRSRFWPFMFDYIEVTMPPPDWNPVPLAGWYIMQGAVTLLAHATHIQFLTLLFPSSLERKFIIAFLGPLCVFASVLFFTHFLADPNYQDLGDAIRNTATSTLSLLYTFGLFIWGYIVNRKRAWEYEGGTFGFGVMSISLALIGTAANFIEVREDRLKWLPWLVNTVLLWQSWAGFWWWVGAGMWSGEVEDIERREARKKRREEKRQRKRLKMLNLISNLSSRDLGLSTAVSTQEPDDQRSTLNRSPSGRGCIVQSNASISCRRSTRFHPRLSIRGETTNQIELDVFTPPLNRFNQDTLSANHAQSPLTETSSSTNDTTNPAHRGILSFIHPPVFLQRWVGTLSAAHNEAAKQQARANRGSREIRRFGLRAMTQRVAFQQKNLSRSNLPTRRSNPLINNPSRPPPSCPTLRRSGSGSDLWVSEDEVVEEHSNSNPSSNPHDGTSHPSPPMPVFVNQDRPPNRSRPPGSSNTPTHSGYEREDRDVLRSTEGYPPGPSSISTRPEVDRGTTSSQINYSRGCLDQSCQRSDHQPVGSTSRNPEAFEDQQNSSNSQNATDHNHHRNWRRPLFKPRLKDVTIYD